MKEFFHKMIKGNSIVPPLMVKRALYQNFSTPLNIEWFNRDDHYEAIFYIDKLEYLARFEPDGTMAEYKTNLPAESLPERISKTARSEGEIMNVVSIHAGQEVSYEIIVRDSNFQRFLTIINQDGTRAKTKPL
jgi:hypothetical protein